MSSLPIEVRERGNEMAKHFGCVVLDNAFLAIWAGLNFGTSLAVERTHLIGTDLLVLKILQYLFGLSTLTPIAIFIYRDVRVMWIRANQQIQDEQKRSVA
jgi:hypothetical protein